MVPIRNEANKENGNKNKIQSWEYFPGVEVSDKAKDKEGFSLTFILNVCLERWVEGGIVGFFFGFCV